MRRVVTAGVVRPSRVAIAVVALVLGLAFAGTAMAEAPPVIDQYQEPLPTGGGNEHTGGDEGSGGGSGGGGAQLPSSTQSNLAGSVSPPVAEALESVATSPELGAPQGTIGKKGKQDAGTGKGSGPSVAPPASDKSTPLTGSPLSDAVSAATDGGNSHLLAVLLALAALTLGGALVAVARRRQTG
jgi:hypothetical protein